jgi:SAM-dependent methyltransferase
LREVTARSAGFPLPGSSEGGPDRGGEICPACAGASKKVAPADTWGHWRACLNCRLEFVEPLRLPEPAERMFDAAYRGLRDTSAMEDFSQRVAQRDAIISDPSLWFWTPAFGRVLGWLHERLPNGGAVFEIGCGLGFVLHELRRQGFDAAGLDVAELAVNLNRHDGFKVWHGQLGTLPDGWLPTPDAVVAFFMLHHLEDPLGLLREIRRRWPRAHLAIAQYGEASPRDARSSQPPRTLTRWGSESMRALLGRAGYSATITCFRSNGLEHRVFRPLSLGFKWTVRFPAAYRLLRTVQRRVLARVTAGFGVDDAVVLAVAEPIQTEPSRLSPPRLVAP